MWEVGIKVYDGPLYAEGYDDCFLRSYGLPAVRWMNFIHYGDGRPLDLWSLKCLEGKVKSAIAWQSASLDERAEELRRYGSDVEALRKEDAEEAGKFVRILTAAEEALGKGLEVWMYWDRGLAEEGEACWK